MSKWKDDRCFFGHRWDRDDCVCTQCGQRAPTHLVVKWIAEDAAEDDEHTSPYVWNFDGAD